MSKATLIAATPNGARRALWIGLLTAASVTLAAGTVDRLSPVLTVALAFAAAFAAYEFALYATAFVLPSSDAAFSWPVVWDILTVNLLAVIGLGLLAYAASMIGLVQRPGTMVPGA